MRKKDQNLVLKIERLKKEYILGTVSGQTLRDALRQRVRGIDICTHNKKFTALDKVSFEVHAGEAVGLIGPNGAGKSTLLKLISRITAPTEGMIYLNGKVSSMLEVGTGFHPELTGRENIYLNGSILGMTNAEIEDKMDSIIEFSECKEFIDTPVKRYSSGMYVKLAFSVAAHLNSEIMIMDEVLAVGDEKFQKKCLEKMRSIAEEEQRTILYVSHNMETIRRLCNRCIVLDRGKLIYDGSVEGAIKLYRGETLKTETSIDLAKCFRPGWLGRSDFRLTWAEYSGKANNHFYSDSVRIYFRWKYNLPVEDAGIRVEFLDDEGKPFATAVKYHLANGEMGENGEGEVEISIEHVMNGHYQTFYTVFVVDDVGNSVDLDCVQGLDIVVEKSKDFESMVWRNAAWGNVQL